MFGGVLLPQNQRGIYEMPTSSKASNGSSSESLGGTAFRDDGVAYANVRVSVTLVAGDIRLALAAAVRNRWAIDDSRNACL